MRPESFIVDRMVAQHCPELLGPTAPSAGELTPALALLSGRFARCVAMGLARLSGGEAPVVRPAVPRGTTAGQLAEDMATLTSYALMGIGSEQHHVLLACAAAPVFRLVDRAFGGRGAVPNPLPEAFPLSAELLILRLEQTVAAALAEALGSTAPVIPLQRDTRLAQVAPFAVNEVLHELAVTVEEPGCEPWTLALAFPEATLTALFGERKPAVTALPTESDPMSEPFASVPITLTAVLVDMAVPFARLAALRPGDVIPVAVARSVPLKAGERTVAAGTIGEFEDRIAVQINTAF